MKSAKILGFATSLLLILASYSDAADFSANDASKTTDETNRSFGDMLALVKAEAAKGHHSATVTKFDKNQHQVFEHCAENPLAFKNKFESLGYKIFLTKDSQSNALEACGVSWGNPTKPESIQEMRDIQKSE